MPDDAPKVGDLYLGKTDHVEDPRDLKLVRYTEAVPTPPKGKPLGHGRLIGRTDWGMLGNDGAGDCVLAGGDHEEMLWAREAGRTVSFTATDALADYSALTGYRPGDPSTDRGTDMRQAMLYRKNTGLRSANGHRHKIEAFTALTTGSTAQIRLALWLFSVAAIGVQFPTSAMDQFRAGKPWSVVRGSAIEGGHYVPVVYYDPSTGLYYCVTWGRLQPVRASFIKEYMDEGYAPLSAAPRVAGKTPEGFNDTQLRADLAAIAA